MLDGILGGGSGPERAIAPMDRDTTKLIDEQVHDAMRSQNELTKRSLAGADMNARPVAPAADGNAIAEKYNRIAGVELGRLRQAAELASIGQRSNNLQRAAQLLISKQKANLGAMQAAQTAKFEAEAARRRTMGQLLNVGAGFGGYAAGGGFKASPQAGPAPVQSPEQITAGYTMPQVGSSAVRGTMGNAAQYQVSGNFGDFGQGGEY